MAFMTNEQKDVLTPLLVEYGRPKFIRIEYTSEAYGVMWIQWPLLEDQRNLFINPDGSRLSWRSLDYGTE